MSILISSAVKLIFRRQKLKTEEMLERLELVLRGCMSMP